MIEPRFSQETYDKILAAVTDSTADERIALVTMSVRAWLDALAVLNGPLAAAGIAYRLADEYVA